VVAHKVVEMPAAPVAQDGEEAAQAPVEKAVVVTVGATPNLPETVLNEFTTNMQKFVSQISHAIQQVTGDIHLTVPDVPAHLSIREAAGDGELVHTLEIAVDSWTNVISSVLAQENHKQLVGTGPISEINYWRSRNASLSGLYEQLRTPAVKRLLATLEESASDALSSFKDQMIELTKLFEEAKNNVKFLTTLERHFKNIASGQLSVIMDTIPPVMAALKMVWIISRHYNKDERMSLLMQLIAIEIAEKVAKEINIRSIFRRRPEEAMQVIRKGKDVLDSWYRTYMSVREQIEGSDSKDRWDFDKKKLFEQTNYMSKICENLFEVAQTLDQFYRFLGPELKSVTGDSAGIDEVLEFVNNLVTPLENLPFNVFNRQYQASWEQVMRSFSEKVEEIETRTKAFIDSSFQKLRSAEGAFELLTNFKNIESRASIRYDLLFFTFFAFT
jgi:dynein heavy chain